MSDMLQLVVEITYTQATILLVTTDIERFEVDDKLKHIGHFRGS